MAITLLSTVQPTKIEWLWKGYLPLGTLTTFAGDGGMGKSTMELDLAARISTGRPMPDGTPTVQGGVVLVLIEDSVSATLVPRLTRMGADLSRIVSVGRIDYTEPRTGYASTRDFSISEDLATLEEAIEAVDARLIVIDPVMNAIGGKTDTYNDQQVRQVLGPLAAIAEKYNCATLVTQHFTKGNMGDVKYRGGGSTAFVNRARTGLTIIPSPDVEGRSILMNTKNNLSKQAASLVYSVASDGEDEPAYIQWHGKDDRTIRELTSVSKPSEVRQELVSLLRDSDKPLTPKEIEEALSGVSGNNVRVLLNRLAREQVVVSPARGKWTLPTRQDKDERTVLDEAVQMFEEGVG